MNPTLQLPAKQDLADLARARAHFVEQGRVTDGVRPVVEKSWHRSAAYGVVPEHLPRQTPDLQRAAAARAASTRLIGAATPLLRQMHDVMGEQPHLIALCDAEGVVLDVLTAGAGSPEELEAANLFPGASWHERDVGCNGAGTCLAQGEPVVLIGPEHYCEAYVGWTCIGVPIRDARGELVGALDVSAPYEHTHVHTWGWTLSVARAIEAAFLPSPGYHGNRRASVLPAADAPLQTVQGILRFLASQLTLTPTHAGFLREAEREVEAAEAELNATLARLRESEEKAWRELASLEALYTTAPVGLCLLDRDLRFVRINDRLAEINGVPVAAHLGRTVREVLPELAVTAEPLLHSVIASGEARFNVEIVGETPARPGVTRCWLEHFLPLRDARGEVFGLNVVAEEVTEQKRAAEERDRLHAETRRALATRDEVLAIVSHDLRNPLSTIGMATELLLDADIAEERRRPQAAIIRRSVDQMKRLIEDLLDAARIEAGTLRVEKAEYAAAALAAAAVQMHGPLAEARAVELALRVEDDAVISADADRILQVLGNLIANALEHTPEGGGVTVSVGARPGAVEFGVADSGVGISPEDLPHVFDRFWQAKRRRRAGAGLGLAIARGLVEAHGGSIAVESEPGRGAKVWFSIPRAFPG